MRTLINQVNAQNNLLTETNRTTEACLLVILTRLLNFISQATDSYGWVGVCACACVCVCGFFLYIDMVLKSVTLWHDIRLQEFIEL
jgi:hypothetical protein